MARDGSTLTANPGTWEGTPTITYEYQWQRCDAAGTNCVNIPGETGSTYTLTPADVGSTIRVLVTAVNDAGSSPPSASQPSATITQLAPSNVTLPQLSGTHRDGETLTTTIGGWNGTAPLDYDVQWQRCDALGANCTDIPDATAWSYVLTGPDVGATVRSEVTATNDAGSATAVSAPSTTVNPAPPVNTTVPAVSGAVRDGQTLTADDGDWTGTDPIGYAHQWERCDTGGANCTDIGGATSATYVLTGTDVGHTVRVEVTATNVAGNAAASFVTGDRGARRPARQRRRPDPLRQVRDRELYDAHARQRDLDRHGPAGLRHRVAALRQRRRRLRGDRRGDREHLHAHHRRPRRHDPRARHRLEHGRR